MLKLFGRIIISLLVVLLLSAGIAYALGAAQPVDHTVAILGVVQAPAARVFDLITDVEQTPCWRPTIKSVTILEQDQGRDHWIEDLGEDVRMDFIATRTDEVSAVGAARRDVQLVEPGGSYGGTWVYELAPGPQPGTTTLKITETGFIKPPFYRFMMRYVFGMRRNLNEYMKNIQAAATKPA